MRHSESPRLPAAAAHVFVDDLEALVLRDDDAHHLGRVLRLRPGEAVTAADGRGGWRACTFGDASLLNAAGDIRHVVAPVPITIAIALTKGDKPELAVQKLTELGVDRVIPFSATHCVVRWDAHKADRNVARLRDVARAAAMQSRRVFLPTVDALTTFANLPAAAPGVALAHPDGAPLADAACPVAIGPEGGFSDDELAAVEHHLDLGGTTLRAETAAVAAGVLLTALRDGRISTNGAA